MERLTLHDLATAIGAALPPASRRVGFDGVGLDSRTLARGEVFWAVRGSNHDGHDYAAQAAARGAAAVVAVGTLAGVACPVLVTPDTVAALGRFAGWYRRLMDAVVVGVTGSVGKTTTRELIFAALGGDAAALRSVRNFNNQLGVPLTLLSIERRHRYAVVEMGASRPGDIRELAAMARPEAGVLTYLGVAHRETFGGVDAIADAKAELLDALPDTGFALLPGDQPAARRVARRCAGAALFVGEGPHNDVTVSEVQASGGRVRLRVDGAAFEVRAAGRHVAGSVGMAVAVARRLGRSDADIALGLQAFEPVAGRGRVVRTAPWTLIDDTYNANPDSMRAALASLADWPTTSGGRRVFVCGDMYGLGDAAGAAHVALGAQAAERRIDLLIAVGSHAGRVAHGARRQGMDARRLACFSTRDAAAAWLAGALRPGDVLWAKASRPLELERLVAALAVAADRADAPRVAA